MIMKLNFSTIKQFSILVFLLAVTFLVKAGGTLQFSQVKLVTTVETVPNNTVWKVISVLGPATTSAANNGTYTSVPIMPASHTISVNGTNVDVAYQLSLGG